jgi:hypothetical protein
MTRHRALAALASLLVLSTLAGAGHASAHEPHPGLQFSIAIEGVPGCDTRESDATCAAVDLGATFQIDVYLDSLPTDISGYGGFDIALEYDGVTPLRDASTDAWPGCGFPASYYDRPGLIGFGCAIGLPPAGPSRYTGLIGTSSFICDRPGSVSLVHGSASGNTDLVESVNLPSGTPLPATTHAEGADTRETININCGAAWYVHSRLHAGLARAGIPPSHGPAVPAWLLPALFAAGLTLIAYSTLRLRSR